jgi:hypothetical protein
MYAITIEEITRIAKEIPITKSGGDGRIDSAIKEPEFLKEIKRILLDKNPTWDVLIPSSRNSFDIMINSIQINLKLSDCKSSDNSASKKAIYYSLTGRLDYPSSSNFNEFYKRVKEAYHDKTIKTHRCKQTEYHYLVKNKITGDVLLKPIFDIHTYVSNASNDMQINWGKEFINADYYTEDVDYLKKIRSLITCLQCSRVASINTSNKFAYADIDSFMPE